MNPENDIAAAYDAFPKDVRNVLLELRRLILTTAIDTKEVSAVTEALKWGQPSYLTKTGTTIRLGRDKASGRPAIFVHCQTSLVGEFRDMFPGVFDFQGNRAVILKDDVGSVIKPLQLCISAALTYHQR
ncbi:DUF1801 domain-containing protein [Parasulfitobacter algicola]|uniref:DUF1801 domain-containing protein n=1 Tax=Parasulfitobacter algicola TaxID=2614809 RepID=A0ABX2IUY9_9RHOB|nr:DUF1801 domain-containing protein [Sulfitobacter algicola]NSX54865.1 DUF1801 domain-containing protein [Sulfitobacter algicola]